MSCQPRTPEIGVRSPSLSISLGGDIPCSSPPGTPQLLHCSRCQVVIKDIETIGKAMAVMAEELKEVKELLKKEKEEDKKNEEKKETRPRPYHRHQHHHKFNQNRPYQHRRNVQQRRPFPPKPVNTHIFFE